MGNEQARTPKGGEYIELLGKLILREQSPGLAWLVVE
jgi:hypothetical protein